VAFKDIPYMPRSTILGHQGDLLAATYAGKRILCWSGRIHRYEGYRGYKLNFIAHMSAYLGCQYLLITCATGGAQAGMAPGTLMLLTDYNNLTGIGPIQSTAAAAHLD
jgi:purine-nucleoside phosphorylase